MIKRSSVQKIILLVLLLSKIRLENIEKWNKVATFQQWVVAIFNLNFLKVQLFVYIFEKTENQVTEELSLSVTS